MKTFELKPVEQNAEVLNAHKAITDLQKLISSVENEFKELDKLVDDTSSKHQTALAAFGLGKITKDELAKIELAMKEAQGKKQKFSGENNDVVMANRKQALKNLEAELLAAEDLAKDKLMSEIDEFIESLRVELQEPIKQIKDAIKILNDVLKQKRSLSPQSSLTTKYNFPFDNLTTIYNYLRCIEYLGTDKIDSDFIQSIDSKLRFLN